MHGRYGNFWAQRAARLTRLAHRRQPHAKWIAFVVLAAVWLGFGLWGWFMQNTSPGDAVYKTLGALTVQGAYENADREGNVYQQVARFAGVLVPLIGLAFAFSGSLGRSLASLYMTGASGHIVIAGASPAALALARSCVRSGDAVVLVASDLAPETAWSMRQDGVVLYEGDGADKAVLQSARVGHAAHFIALTVDDVANLKMEASVRACTHARRRKPLAAHIAIASPLLLVEAREMRTQLQAQRDAAAKAAGKEPVPEPVDSRPFSLDELAARALINHEAGVLLNLAERQKHPGPHLVLFGFERAAEAVAVRALMSLWSIHFNEPRITVVSPDPELADAQFAARYPHASSHDVWRADIAFMAFNWREQALTLDFLKAIEAARGPATGVVIDTGVEAETIQLAFALLRTATVAGDWPIPIYLKQAAASEFTQMFAAGVRSDQHAYMKAFGMVETTADRTLIVEGALDRGAALAHMVYVKNLKSADSVDKRQLEAFARGWSDIRETYRAANRAAADSALVKMWDFGWRPALAREAGVASPPLDDGLKMRLAEIEHKRWNAERLLSGWRPGPLRNNAMMVHNNLVPWRDLSDELRSRDLAQVEAAVSLARLLYPKGFAADPRRLMQDAGYGSSPSA